MKRKAMLWVTAAIAVPILGVSQSGSNGKSTSISGWVIDSSCAYTKGLDKPISPACAKACAKNGSPLVILRDDGTIFLPIDEATPATGQNEKLTAFAGKRAVVKGRSFTRSGSQAIVIDKIEAAK